MIGGEGPRVALPDEWDGHGHVSTGPNGRPIILDLEELFGITWWLANTWLLLRPGIPRSLS